jgi:hypothetical protein
MTATIIAFPRKPSADWSQFDLVLAPGPMNTVVHLSRPGIKKPRKIMWVGWQRPDCVPAKWNYVGVSASGGQPVSYWADWRAAHSPQDRVGYLDTQNNLHAVGSAHQAAINVARQAVAEAQAQLAALGGQS